MRKEKQGPMSCHWDCTILISTVSEKGQPTSQQSIADTPLPGEDGAPAPTEAVAEFGEQAYDRAWCGAILNFSNLKWIVATKHRKTWEDRELIWRARRMVHVYRANQGQAPSGPLPYEQALLGYVEFALLGSSNPNMSLNSLNGLKVDFVNTIVK